MEDILCFRPTSKSETVTQDTRQQEIWRNNCVTPAEMLLRIPHYSVIILTVESAVEQQNLWHKNRVSAPVTLFGLCLHSFHHADVSIKMSPDSDWLCSPFVTETAEVVCSTGPDKERETRAPSGPYPHSTALSGAFCSTIWSPKYEAKRSFPSTHADI